MVTVAVAGGTGSLGRAIVDALNAAKYDVVVLARQAGNEEAANKIGVRRIVAADYANVDALVSLLEANAVHTLISTINTIATADEELNLMRAAERAEVTRRYIPSIWGVKVTPETATYLPITVNKLAIQTALSALPPPASPLSRLEHTTIYNAYFADYYLDRSKIPSYITPWSLAIDIPHGKAALPGDGNRPIVFNHTTDIAKYVVALLGLPMGTWQPDSWIASSRVSFLELVGLIEEATHRKFEVTYDSLEKLKTGTVTELPGHVDMYPGFPKEQLQFTFAGFERMIVEGVFDPHPEGKTLNEMFPEIKGRTMRELISESWKE